MLDSYLLTLSNSKNFKVFLGFIFFYITVSTYIYVLTHQK